MKQQRPVETVEELKLRIAAIIRATAGVAVSNGCSE